MRVGTLNCNSLVNKTAGVIEHLNDQLVDVCLLQETYLRKGDDAKIQEMKDRGWEIYSAPRKQRIGGGVAIIYKADLGVKNCGAKSFKTFESIEATIGNATELIRLVNIYRPPYSKRAPHTQSQFLAEFKEYQEELDDKVGKTLVMGDFNFHMERPQEFYPKKLQELLEESGLSQLVPIKLVPSMCMCINTCTWRYIGSHHHKHRVQRSMWRSRSHLRGNNIGSPPGES